LTASSLIVTIRFWQAFPNTFIKLGIVHNGLDTSLLHFVEHPQGWQNQPYLTWLGKIMPWKGLDIAIQVTLKTHHRLVFAGVLDETNHPESKVYFKQKIEPFIDGDQIQFLGPANLALKDQLLGNALAFLNPITWEEPFGMVSTESMATGTPVISFNRGGARESIIDRQTGFLVQDQSAMIDAVSHIDQIDRQVTRQHIEKHFSAAAMSQKYLKLYQQTIAARPHSSSTTRQNHQVGG
jgi:glycosyltransferase involved in cell wall biosynthesis